MKNTINDIINSGEININSSVFVIAAPDNNSNLVIHVSVPLHQADDVRDAINEAFDKADND